MASITRNPSDQNLDSLGGGGFGELDSVIGGESWEVPQEDDSNDGAARAAGALSLAGGHGAAGQDDGEVQMPSPTAAAVANTSPLDSGGDPFFQQGAGGKATGAGPPPRKRSRRQPVPSARRLAAERDNIFAEDDEALHGFEARKPGKKMALGNGVKKAAPSRQDAAAEVTLQVCLHLLQNNDSNLQERPAHISEEVDPYLLFLESPKQKRTAAKWGGVAGRIDRWANSGGVSGAHDYFPSGSTGLDASGVRKRYGRIVRQGMPCAPPPPPLLSPPHGLADNPGLRNRLLKFFEFTLITKGFDRHGGEDNTEDKTTVLFQVFSETSRAAPGKRHWETAESREGGVSAAAGGGGGAAIDDYPEISEEVWQWREKELQRLKELYECGLLTDDVYDDEQRRCLAGQTGGRLPSQLPATSPQAAPPAAAGGVPNPLSMVSPRTAGASETLGALGEQLGKQVGEEAKDAVTSVIAPLDALLKASTMMLGVDGASIITSAYEETSTSDEMWWKTALQWWCIGESAKNTQGRSAATAVWRKCLSVRHPTHRLSRAFALARKPRAMPLLMVRSWLSVCVRVWSAGIREDVAACSAGGAEDLRLRGALLHPGSAAQPRRSG